MLSSRDKMLAGLFAIQLAAAAAFGAVLVHGLHHEAQGTQTFVSQGGAPAAATLPGGAPAPAAATSAGDPGAAPSPGAPVATGSAAADAAASAAAGASQLAGGMPTAPAAAGSTDTTGPRTVTTIVGGSSAVAGTSASPVAGTSHAAGKSAAANKGTTASGGPGATAGAGGGGSGSGATASAAAGGSGGGTSEIAAGAPITIGSIVTETGAINFNSSAQGTKAYFDMVNAAGGVDGHQLKLIQDDDQLMGNVGDAEFKQLAMQGIFAYGAFNAPETEGNLKSLLDGTNIPLIGSYGEYDEYHDNLAFAFTADYVHFGYEMGLYLKNLGVKTPALLYVDNNDDRANSQITDGFAAGFGSAAAYVDKKSPTDTYQNDITQMRLDNVDGLASILDTASYSRYLQAAGSYNTQIKHVADPLFNVPSIKSLSNAAGTYVASDFDFVDSGSAANTAYVNAVNAEFGSNAQIDYIGEVGWFDGELIVDALKSMNGVYTKAGLIKAVESLGTYTTGLTSPLPFSTGNRDVNRCIQFGMVNGGKVVPTQGYTCDTQAA